MTDQTLPGRFRGRNFAPLTSPDGFVTRRGISRESLMNILNAIKSVKIAKALLYEDLRIIIGNEDEVRNIIEVIDRTTKDENGVSRAELNEAEIRNALAGKTELEIRNIIEAVRRNIEVVYDKYLIFN